MTRASVVKGVACGAGRRRKTVRAWLVLIRGRDRLWSDVSSGQGSIDVQVIMVVVLLLLLLLRLGVLWLLAVMLRGMVRRRGRHGSGLCNWKPVPGSATITARHRITVSAAPVWGVILYRRVPVATAWEVSVGGADRDGQRQSAGDRFSAVKSTWCSLYEVASRGSDAIDGSQGS